MAKSDHACLDSIEYRRQVRIIIGLAHPPPKCPLPFRSGKDHQFDIVGIGMHDQQIIPQNPGGRIPWPSD